MQGLMTLSKKICSLTLCMDPANAHSWGIHDFAFDTSPDILHLDFMNLISGFGIWSAMLAAGPISALWPDNIC